MSEIVLHHCDRCALEVPAPQSGHPNGWRWLYLAPREAWEWHRPDAPAVPIAVEICDVCATAVSDWLAGAGLRVEVPA